MNPGFAPRVLALATLGLLGGCSSWVVNGAEGNASLPRTYLARFKATRCQNHATGAVVEGPKDEYYLASDEEGFALYEVGESRAAVLRNGWADEKGRHFFAWISASTGWLYTFPRDAAAEPLRWVYLAGTYSIAEEGAGKYRPVGAPAFRCTLTRHQPPDR